MPEEIREDRTKRQLDSALRRLLEEKSLERIRVRELTELCGIRRQSFYYHFPDVPALFDWSLARETELLLAGRERCLTWRQALAALLERIRKHRAYYRALLAERGRAGLGETLALEALLETTLDYYSRRDGSPRASRIELICWETVLVSLLEGWIREEMPGNMEALLDLLEAKVRQGAMGAAWRNTL